MIFAGTLTATTLSGNDFLTTALAPIVTLFPMTIPPSTNGYRVYTSLERSGNPRNPPFQGGL